MFYVKFNKTHFILYIADIDVFSYIYLVIKCWEKLKYCILFFNRGVYIFSYISALNSETVELIISVIGGIATQGLRLLILGCEDVAEPVEGMHLLLLPRLPSLQRIRYVCYVLRRFWRLSPLSLQWHRVPSSFLTFLSLSFSVIPKNDFLLCPQRCFTSLEMHACHVCR